MGEGNCGLSTTELVALAEELLEVPQSLVKDAIGFALA
jgi:hypothetical protein